MQKFKDLRTKFNKNSKKKGSASETASSELFLLLFVCIDYR